MGKRFMDLFAKIVSVKGTVYITATVAMFLGKIDPLTWFFAGVTWISIRLLEKIFVKKEQ